MNIDINSMTPTHWKEQFEKLDWKKVPVEEGDKEGLRLLYTRCTNEFRTLVVNYDILPTLECDHNACRAKWLHLVTVKGAQTYCRAYEGIEILSDNLTPRQREYVDQTLQVFGVSASFVSCGFGEEDVEMLVEQWTSVAVLEDEFLYGSFGKELIAESWRDQAAWNALVEDAMTRPARGELIEEACRLHDLEQNVEFQFNRRDG